MAGPGSLAYTDTFHVFELLRRFWGDPAGEQARRAIGLVREHVTWGDGAWWNPPWAESGFFEGESSRVSNGNVVSHFGVDMTPLVDRLLGEQLPDGGCNSRAHQPPGPDQSSFDRDNVLRQNSRIMPTTAG